MKNSRQLEQAVLLAKRFNVGRLYLLGSSLIDEDQAQDYDFAIDGVPAGVFFEFYAEMLKLFSKPVDLINLDGETSKFGDLVRGEGRILYDESKN